MTPVPKPSLPCTPTPPRGARPPALWRRLAGVLALLLGGAATAQAEDVELFDRPNFQGQRLSIGQDTPDLTPFNMRDRAMSLRIQRGTWEFCTAPRYGGVCVPIGPGSYPELPPGVDQAVASVRLARIGAVPVPGPERPTPQPPFFPPGGPGASPRDAVVLFQTENFDGERLGLSFAAGNLADLSFNDRARSVLVRSGRWTLCQHADYEGECRTYGPGQHVLEGRLRGGVSSVRPQSGNDAGRPGDDRPGGGWGNGGARIVLYEHGSGNGRSLTVTEQVNDLSSLNFNDITSSVEVLRGRWELCTDAVGGGRCVVLDRGRHEIERSMNDRISSLRPVR